jgi:hypothetical protein
MRININYLVEPGTASLCKVSVPVVVVHVEGGEGETVVAVHGVPRVTVVQVLMVQAERVPLTPQSGHNKNIPDELKFLNSLWGLGTE